jgi:hypothetical protein
VRATEIAGRVGLSRVRRVGSLERVLTHRVVRFDVYRGVGEVEGVFKTRRAIGRLGMSSAQREVLEMAGVCARG